MIWNDAQTVLYNGAPVQTVLCNNVVVWPHDGITVRVNNSDSAVAIGLSAYAGDAMIYAHAPTTASYVSDRIQSGSRVEYAIVTEIGKRGLWSTDNLSSIRYKSRTDDTVSASALYSASVVDNASIDMTSHEANTFFASASSYSIGDVISNQYYDVAFRPVAVTWASGDTRVITSRNLAYEYTDSAGSHEAQSSVYYLANKTYSAVSASARASFSISPSRVLSATVSNGVASASSYSNTFPLVVRTARTASTFRPSSTSMSATNFISWSWNVNTTASTTYTANVVGGWCMSGIAP